MSQREGGEGKSFSFHALPVFSAGLVILRVDISFPSEVEYDEVGTGGRGGVVSKGN